MSIASNFFPPSFESIGQTRDTRAERVFLVGVELKSGNIAIGDSGILL